MPSWTNVLIELIKYFQIQYFVNSGSICDKYVLCMMSEFSLVFMGRSQITGDFLGQIYNLMTYSV